MRNDWEFWRGAATATAVAVMTGIGWHVWNAHRAARSTARALRDRTARTRASLDRHVDSWNRSRHTRPFDWRTDADLKETTR